MSATVRIMFEDGSIRVVRDYADLATATAAALDLADRQGTSSGDGAGRPERVQVVIGGRVELSIRVLGGGLRARYGAP